MISKSASYACLDRGVVVCWALGALCGLPEAQCHEVESSCR
jgi:hypothetical protein